MYYVTVDQWGIHGVRIIGKDTRKPGVYDFQYGKWLSSGCDWHKYPKDGHMFVGRRWTGDLWARTSLYCYLRGGSKVQWLGDIVNPPALTEFPPDDGLGYYLFDGRKIVTPGPSIPWFNAIYHEAPTPTLESLFL